MNKAMSRRAFLSMRCLTDAVQRLVAATGNEATPSGVASDLKDYFRSPLYSYAFIQDLPWDMLVAEAGRLGIPVTSRDKGSIVLDLLTAGDKDHGV